MQYDVFTFGELLKDVHFRDLTEEQIQKISPNMLEDFRRSGKIVSASDGGAPANVAANLAMLGHNARFTTRVGDDSWGREMISNFNRYGVFVNENETYSGDFSDAALVHTDGERHSFVKFLWGSLPNLNPDLVSEEEVRKSDIVHVGSLTSLSFPQSGQAVERAIRYAKKHEKIISFDPTLRPGIYTDLRKMGEKLQFMLENSDVVKFSGAELLFESGINPKVNRGEFSRENLDYHQIVKYAKRIKEVYPIDLLLITLGEAGAFALEDDRLVWSSSYDYGRLENTIGAGDSFVAAALKKYNDGSLPDDTLDYACRVSGITVTDRETISEKVRMLDILDGKVKYKSFNEFWGAANRQLKKEFEDLEVLLGRN